MKINPALKFIERYFQVVLVVKTDADGKMSIDLTIPYYYFGFYPSAQIQLDSYWVNIFKKDEEGNFTKGHFLVTRFSDWFDVKDAADRDLRELAAKDPSHPKFYCDLNTLVAEKAPSFLRRTPPDLEEFLRFKEKLLSYRDEFRINKYSLKKLDRIETKLRALAAQG